MGALRGYKHGDDCLGSDVLHGHKHIFFGQRRLHEGNHSAKLMQPSAACAGSEEGLAQAHALPSSPLLASRCAVGSSFSQALGPADLGALPGQGPVQPAVGDPALAGGLD